MIFRKKQVWLLLVGFWLLMNLTGCVTITEWAKGFTGLSTKVLEEARGETIKETFNYDYNTCYDKTKSSLQGSGSYIYAQDRQIKKMIALYVSEEDTTPVGVFFKVVDSTHTQVEVSSPSIYARELIARRIFSALSGKEEEIDAKKDLESQ